MRQSMAWPKDIHCSQGLGLRTPDRVWFLVLLDGSPHEWLERLRAFAAHAAAPTRTATGTQLGTKSHSQPSLAAAGSELAGRRVASDESARHSSAAEVQASSRTDEAPDDAWSDSDEDGACTRVGASTELGQWSARQPGARRSCQACRAASRTPDPSCSVQLCSL